MNFGVKKTVEANEVSNELAGKIYPNAEVQKGNDFVTLEKLCDVFANRITLHKETAGKKFTCYIEKKAYDAFIQFANETYQSHHHEATGLIVGYYLYDKDNPESRFIVGTHFLKASGESSSVTTEFSYIDSINHSVFCNEHKLLPLIWIHSHPGFGIFYSDTDCTTLKTLFAAKHQMGVVVDNLKNQVLGYKMYDNKMLEENVFLLDLDKSNTTKWIYYQQNKKKEILPVVVDIDEKEEITKDTEEKIEEIKALEIKVENLENEIAGLKKVEKIQRPAPNVIIWTFSVLFVLFLVGGAVSVINFKYTNALKKSFVGLMQQLDSLKNSIVVTPVIIDEVNPTTPETIVEDTVPVLPTTETTPAKTENSNKLQTTIMGTEKAAVKKKSTQGTTTPATQKDTGNKENVDTTTHKKSESETEENEIKKDSI